MIGSFYYRNLLKVIIFSIVMAVLPTRLGAVQDRAILVVGDSISAAYGIAEDRGWVALLQVRLDQKDYGFITINASITGETTSGGASRIAALLQSHRPDIVIIELGGNDGLRGLSLSAMKNNLSHMIAMSQESGARVLLLGMRIPPNYGPQYTRKFHNIYRQLAEQYGTALVPFVLEGVALVPGMMQGDGIHPSAAAQPVMLDKVWEQLLPLLHYKPD